MPITATNRFHDGSSSYSISLGPRGSAQPSVNSMPFITIGFASMPYVPAFIAQGTSLR
jgi:hypothetical protein